MTNEVSKKIVIIEDETMLQEALVENLKAEGFLVRGCSSAVEAFETINEDIPDLVLTDLVMQDIDGYEVLITLKKSRRLKGVPVVVLSNLGEVENIEKAKSLGAADYIVKAENSLDDITNKVKKMFG